MTVKDFFSRLTGAGEAADDDFDEAAERMAAHKEGGQRLFLSSEKDSGEETAGELAVDVYQTPDAIVVKAFIAGVQPNTVDISVTREMLTISGTRQEEREVDEEHYFQRELYWGPFTRTILLPEEVDVDLAEASEKHGVLIIRLPKINKKKEMKLKVRSR